MPTRSYCKSLSILLAFGVIFRASSSLATFACKNIFTTPDPQLSTPEFEVPSNRRLQWIYAQNRHLNARLNKSQNKKGFEKLFWGLFGKDEVVQSEDIPGLGSYQLIDRGIGKPQEFIFTSGTSSKVLHSNFKEKRNGSVRLLKFSLSPTKEFAALTFFERGSTDRFFNRILNLSTGQVSSAKLPATKNHIAWVDRFTIVFEAFAGQTTQRTIFRHDVRSPDQFQISSWTKIYNGDKEWLVGFHPQNGFSFYNNITGRSLSIGSKGLHMDGDTPIVGSDGRHLYLHMENENGQTWIGRIQINQPSNIEKVVPETQFKISEAKLKEGYLFIRQYFGNDRRLQVCTPQGQVVITVPTPDCCRSGNSKWIIPGQKLEIEYSSAVQKNISFVFDAHKNTFEDPQLESKMMTRDGQVYQQKVITAKSADGTLIPIRVTHLQGTPLNRENGVLISAYGGFSIPDAFYPQYSPARLEFLKRGGVLAGPALRGGDEFGQPWHKAAQHQNKEKTFEDLIATAETLISSGYTKNSKIVITGASNGGLVVAATALKRPDLFGLVIPINGVHDMLNKDRFDTEFNGWAYEYGNNNDLFTQSYLRRYSPVEQASLVQQAPLFLMIVGRQDSRVNTSHSYKLASALKKNPHVDSDSVLLTSLNNGGHWVQNPPYQNVLGWRSQVVIWTTIFDHLEMKLAPEKAP